MTVRARRCGTTAWLLECGSEAEVGEVYRSLLGAPGVVELVPAARTVLVETGDGVLPQGRPTGAGGAVDRAEPRPALELPTSYHGPDLAEVATRTGMSPAEVIDRHQAPEYTVAFCGFAPGFGYLTGGDPALVVPRRPSPRPAVPPGSVGLAGPYTGVYPRRSPGGWQLIGTTGAPLWDLGRPEPALLTPGRQVRFVPVRHR